MSRYQIAVIVGSLRKDAINRKLANALIKLAPPDFSFNMVEIGDLPLYNQDNDANPAPSVKRFKSELAAANGFIFVTPEYNRSIPGALKNALDNGSRPPGQNAWAGKPAGIVGASMGALGTAAAQQHLRNILAFLDMPLLGQPEVFLQVKEGFFDEGGNIANPDTKKFLQGWMSRYAAWVGRITA